MSLISYDNSISNLRSTTEFSVNFFFISFQEPVYIPPTATKVEELKVVKS